MTFLCTYCGQNTGTYQLISNYYNISILPIYKCNNWTSLQRGNIHITSTLEEYFGTKMSILNVLHTYEVDCVWIR
jgi:hypothetical protein